MTDTLTALLHAVRQEYLSDAPRLALADWLEEEGHDEAAGVVRRCCGRVPAAVKALASQAMPYRLWRVGDDSGDRIPQEVANHFTSTGRAAHLIITEPFWHYPNRYRAHETLAVAVCDYVMGVLGM